MNKIKLEFNPENGKYCWELLESISVTLSNGDSLIIEKGLQTDLSSSPKFLWWLFPPYGKFLLAALIHDYLYINDYKKSECNSKEARAFADYQMLYFSNKLNDNKTDNYLRYWAVRLFGKKVWSK